MNFTDSGNAAAEYGGKYEKVFHNFCGNDLGNEHHSVQRERRRAQFWDCPGKRHGGGNNIGNNNRDNIGNNRDNIGNNIRHNISYNSRSCNIDNTSNGGSHGK